MNIFKLSMPAARVLAITASIGWASWANAATLFTTGVDDPNWQGAMLSDGGDFAPSQEITLSSTSELSSLQWTGQYCYLSGAGCLKTGYEGFVDNFYVEIVGETIFNSSAARSPDLNWSSGSAVVEYTLFLDDYLLEAGNYTISIWNELNLEPEFAWYWTFGGDSGTDLSITVSDSSLAPIPLPLSGLLLLGGIGTLGLLRSRRKAA